jgi:hypothetical protein
MKAIKLSDTHYVYVEDHVKAGDYVVTYPDKKIIQVDESTCGMYDERITQSTEPLEYIWKANYESYTGWVNIRKLSISEAEELIYGYNVEKMAEDEVKRRDNLSDNNKLTVNEKGFAEKWMQIGFKAHKELVKDKVFTVKDMEFALVMARKNVLIDPWNAATKPQFTIEEIVRIMLPETIWEIEPDEQGKLKLV